MSDPQVPYAPTGKAIYIFMGVSSSGKTSVGEAFAQRLGVDFLDGDTFHPQANIDKMKHGTPLTDADRWPWLLALASALSEYAQQHTIAVSACSALRRSYRDALRKNAGMPLHFIYLQGDKSLLATRAAARTHEYMPATLLDSQFETLEEPESDENILIQSVENSVQDIVNSTLLKMNLIQD